MTYAMISYFGSEVFWFGRFGPECFEQAFLLSWRLGVEVQCMPVVGW